MRVEGERVRSVSMGGGSEGGKIGVVYMCGGSVYLMGGRRGGWCGWCGKSQMSYVGEFSQAQAQAQTQAQPSDP